MLVEPLETINGPLETNGPLDIKEQGSEQSSRSRRDGKDVIHSAPTPLARNGTIRSIDTMLSVATEQGSVAEEREGDDVNDETRGGGHDDYATRDGAAADVSIDLSKMGKVDEISITPEDQSSSCCLLSALTDVGNNIDTAIQQFYSKVELGASKIFPCYADAVEVEEIQDDVTLDVETGTNKQVDSPRSFIGTTIKDIATSNVHILDNFCDESSEDDSILDNFYDESFEDDTITLEENLTMEGRKLLDEIKDIEETLQWQVRKCSSMKDMTEVKKRQVPYLQQVSTIRQRLLEQQELLKSAPEDTKKKYYNAVSKAAVINAEVETRRAELELKKIRLESMRVDEEMGRICYKATGATLIARDSTCSAPVSVSVTADSDLIYNDEDEYTFETDKTSVDDSMSHGVSDAISFSTPIKNFRGRVRKNKDRLRHVASTLKDWITITNQRDTE